MGQALQKKSLSEEDYQRWGEMHINEISPDENWASYKMQYSNGSDTLFIKNVHRNIIYSVPGGNSAVFTDNNLFICKSGNDMHIINLKTTKKEIIPGVRQFFYRRVSKDLIYLQNSEVKKDYLVIYSLKNNTHITISAINDCMISPDEKYLACTGSLENKNGLALISLKKPYEIKWLDMEIDAKYTGLTWQNKGEAVAFVKDYKDIKKNELFLFKIAASRLYKLDKTTYKSMETRALVFDPLLKMLISEDMKKIFFAFKDITTSPALQVDSKVEIWNANDKWIYPDEKSHGGFDKKSKLALWQPDAEKVNVITTEEFPSVMLTNDMQFAILSNPKEYEPQFEPEEPRDFYILNLKTFEKKLILKKQPFHLWSLTTSPKGKYFAYFKENNWWVYNPVKDTHTNITVSINVRFTGKEQELVPESVFGNPGWSLDDKEILIYDQYDLWAITPDGKNFKKLTHGREKKITYRIVDTPVKTKKYLLYDALILQQYDLDKGLLLRARGYDEKTGYFTWNKSAVEEIIWFGDSYVDEAKFNENKHNIFFREQKFDMPPRLIHSTGSSSKISIFNSNPQQDKYFWGKSELIEFQNSQMQDLKAVLLYPANYDPSKKYPMIVYIYEGKARELHLYQNPTLFEGGLNVTLMTQKGYFVLLPDIKLSFQNPGISAADCVISATEKIIEKGIIMPDKIGLTGHSFGGYETSFIMTQTQLFATAIASGAITDFISFYHTVSPRSGRPDMWRFQTEQFNMGGTPYEFPLLYHLNSPLSNITNIQKPILLWTGKNDKQVDPHQSIEFYLALRRLGKKSILLMYPDEGHSITDPVNQKDITIRMIEWFNYFLKDDHSYQWINKGTK